MSLVVESLNSIEQAAELRTLWSALAPSPQQTPEWLLAWWDAYSTPNMQLQFLVFRSQPRGEIIGLAPFCLRNSWKFGRCLRFLGSGQVCSDHQRLLCRPGNDAEVVLAFARWLCNKGAHSWDVLELDGIAQDRTHYPQLVAALGAENLSLHTSQLQHTWRLNLADGWDGFVNNLAKTQRRQTRNLLNRFAKSDDFRFRFVADADVVKQLLPACIELHQARWTAAGESGCFADKRFRSFFEDAATRLADTDRFRIALAEHGNEPIAALMFLRDPATNELYLYQSGRDPNYDSARIGQTLNLICVQHACELGVPAIDYLRGDEVYKTRLRAEPTPCLRLRAFAPGAISQLRYGAFRLGKSVKQFASSWTQPAAGDSVLATD